MQSKPKYKLYKENRCYGNRSLREKIERIFVVEELNKCIHFDDDKSKTYIIQKFIDEDLRWRQLGRMYYHKNCNFNYCEKGDLTTTWCRIIYDDKSNKWKETNYRYTDEIIC